MKVDADLLRERLNGDGEFGLAARFWNGRFKLEMGDDHLLVSVHDGHVERIDARPTPFDPWDFLVSGPEDGWAKLLQPLPPPFYQDVWSASFHHGFGIGGDLEQFYAYHAAVRRMTQIMRQLVAS